MKQVGEQGGRAVIGEVGDERQSSCSLRLSAAQTAARTTQLPINEGHN